MKLTIDIPFTTLNDYINAERTNKQMAAAIKKKQTNGVSLAIYNQIKHIEKPLTGKYNIDFNWFKPSNRTDHDNIAFCKKYVLDGLKVAKLIQDDSPLYINNFTDSFVLDKSKDYIWCEIELIKVYE